MKKALVLLWAMVFAIASCKKDDEKPAPNPTVTAEAGTAQTVSVGQTVTLDASSSSDSQGKTLTFNWTVTKKPTGSAITLTGQTTAKPTFVPDVAGEYEMEVAVTSDNGTAKDKVTITANAVTSTNPVLISEDITADRVLTNIIADPTKPDYIVTADITVNAKLTINPGVIIQVETNKGIYIDNSPLGSIVAKGTATEKIIFTGKQQTAGYWKGIMIYSSSPLNEMDYVEVAYGGSSALTGVSVKSDLVVYGNATPGGSLKVTNSSFTNSGGYGLYFEKGATIAGFANNTASNNTGIALFTAVDQLHMIDAASKFNSNNAGYNGVEIVGATEKDTDEATWPAFTDGAKYLVSTDIEIHSGVKIAPGAAFEFASNKALYIDDNGGYLVAKGTAAGKITFTGKQKTAGFWKGIMIYSSSPLNEMDYVEVSYGGNSSLTGVSVKSNLVVYGNATPGGSLKVTNSSFTNSGGYGLYFEKGATITGFANNTASNNTGIALFTAVDQLHMIDAASKFNSNNAGYNGVEIVGATEKDTDEATWPAFTDGAKYLVSTDIEINSGVKIAPGAMFEFASTKALYVNNNGGYIIAKGTSTQRIGFTGKQKSAGFWKGIMIYSSNSLNTMDYVDIAYGGSGTLTGVNVKSNLVVYDNATPAAALKITNSNITNSGGWGIVTAAANFGSAINTDIETANFYAGNLGGNVQKKQ